MQYYLEYCLGWRGPSGQKADKGTIVHKVLEIAARCKEGDQNGKKIIVDDLIGRVSTCNPDPKYLEKVIGRVYKKYTDAAPHHDWKEKDKKDCVKWVWKALEYNDGMFDPRNRDIVAAEPHFDIELDKEWAQYSYNIKGENISGNLSLKGTVDLVTDLGDGVYEIVDWKTGRRLDWATGDKKEQKDLFKDPQLRIYHYAAKHLYPHVDTFLVTVYFINDGGAFTVHFHDEDLPKTEQMLKNKFEFIKNTTEPQTLPEFNPSQCWKCSKLCYQGKTTFEETDIKPLTELRVAKRTKHGEIMTKCEQARYMIDKYGIDWVTENLSNPDHSIGTYNHPGEI
jgi:hypothetical protein